MVQKSALCVTNTQCCRYTSLIPQEVAPWSLNPGHRRRTLHLSNDAVSCSRRTTNRYRTQSRKLSRSSWQSLFPRSAPPVVTVGADTRRPVRCPLDISVSPSISVGCREVEEVSVQSQPQLVPDSPRKEESRPARTRIVDPNRGHG